MTDDLLACDAIALSNGFATGMADPREVLDACLTRLEECDPVVGACNHLCGLAAMREAAARSATRWRRGEALSRFDGVPFGVKANIAVHGMPWHAGIAAFKNRVAQRDAACVAQLRVAGMVPIAIFNMHEGALGVTTDNPAFGATRNPHDPTRIAGGSSGGSAAAVATGVVPVALGTDSLGSVRLPSALCGIVGYKPARDEIPLDGVVPLSPRLDHVGVHTRSIADVSAVMAILSGRRDRPTVATVPALSRWQTETALEPRLACAFDRVDVRQTVDWSDVDLGKVRRAGLFACERAAACHFADALRDNPDGFSDEFRSLMAWAADQPVAKIRQADEVLDDVAVRMGGVLAGTLLLGPTSPCSAPAHDTAVDADIANLTAPAAIAGVPAVSVPLPASSGLPIGMQVTGLEGDDVLRAAQALFPGTAPLAFV